MKHLLTLIMAVMAVQAALAATVKVQIEDLYYNLDTSAKTAAVTYDTSSSPTSSNPAYANFSDKNLTIPGTVEYSEEQYTVTSIGGVAFSYCSGLTSVTFPESLTSIGISAFADCSGLKEVNIKSLESWLKLRFPDYRSNPNYYAKNLLIDGVELSGTVNLPPDWTEVPNYQFMGCKAVTEFILPEMLTTIGSYAFQYCSGLTSVNLPENITSIGLYAFRDCSGLTSVNLPENLTSIGNFVFYGCSGLTSVNLPENITSIGLYAFNDCSGLTSVNLPENLTSIGEFAFAGCSGLKEVNIKSLEAWLNIKFSTFSSNPNYYAKNLLIDGVELAGTVNLPTDLTEIPNYQFMGCKAVTEFILPENITSIGLYAFNDCSGLTSVNLPENLTSIGEFAFAGCSGLTSIFLPENLTSIDTGAFYDCSDLKEVNIKSLEAWLNIKFDNYSSNPNYYAKNLLIDGVELSGTVNLPAEWTEVPTAQFEGCKAVTEFILPGNLTSIGGYAFFNCSGLTSVTFPESLTSIGDRAFAYCSGLTSVTFPESLTSIGISAFNGCSGLTSITLPESLTSIDARAFNSCYKLLKVVSLNPTTPTNTSNSFGNPAESTGILYVPEASLEAYQSTNYWKEFQNIEPIVLATGLELFAEKNPLATGRSMQLTATLSPEDATVDQFIWSSSDQTVATVDAFGKVTALKAGTTTISAKTIDGSGVEATLELTVTDSQGAVTIEDFDICIGETKDIPVNLTLNFPEKYSALQFDTTLPAGISFAGATLGEQMESLGFELTSGQQENGDIRVIVTPNGYLDGTDICENVLTLSLTATPSATPGKAAISIRNASLSSIDGADIYLDNSTVEATVFGTLVISGETAVIKETQTLQLTASYAETTDFVPTVVWSSSAPEIASVKPETGLVTGLAVGSATITAVVAGNDAVKATYEIEVQKRLPGDANDNGSVTVADVVTIANHIVGNYVASWCFVNADVNGSGDITTADINATINIIAGEQVADAAMRREARMAGNDRLVTDDFSAVSGEPFSIGVRLDNRIPYSSLQASVIVPEGMTVESVTAGAQAPAHSMIYNITDRGRVEVVLFSTSNEPFAQTDGSLFDLRVSADADCGDLMIENILASDASATDYRLSFEGGHNRGTQTGIDSMTDNEPRVAAERNRILVYNAEGQTVSIFSTTGQLCASRKATANPESFELARGIYVVTIGNSTFKIKL